MSHENAKGVQIEASWKAVLADAFEQPYFQAIRQFLRSELQAGKRIYPPGRLLFNAFDSTPFHAVKAVILGQDPYHQPGQAMGLSFSVPKGQPVPPSLKTVYRELASDVPGFRVPAHGDLSAWAAQGVLLLNAMLSVEEGRAGSHQKIGWEHFTDAVIRQLSAQREGLVFMLWGNFARKKAALIDAGRHLILEAAHPSPLARDAFIGCRHFSQCNAYLAGQGCPAIDWQL